MLILVVIIAIAYHIYLAITRPIIALATSFVASIALFVVSYESQSIVGCVLSPMIFVAALATFAFGQSECTEGVGELRKLARYVLALILFGVAVVLPVSVLSPERVGMLIVGLLAFLLIILPFVVVRYLLRSREETAAYVVSTIGASMRQNLPLAAALASAATNRRDKQAAVLLRIAKWLENGYPLSEAIKVGYPKCPGDVVAMIAMAERVGQVPQAFKSLEANILEAVHERRRIKPVEAGYPFVVLVVTYTIVLYLMIFIVPRWRDIFADFGVKMPWATEVLVGLYGASRHWCLWILVFLVGVWWPFRLWTRFRPRRADKPRLTSRVGDFVKWHLPILRWFELNYSLTQVVELLRVSLRSGCTVDQAIANAAELDVNGCFRRRLSRWHGDVVSGMDISVAASKAGMGRPLAWAFDQKINQGNTPAILESLESFYRSNYSYRVNLARYIFWPCSTLAVAAVVGFVVYAVFTPLVELIDQTARSVVP